MLLVSVLRSINNDVMQFWLRNHHNLIASRKNPESRAILEKQLSVIAGCSRSPTQRPLMLKKQIAFLHKLRKTPAGLGQ